MQQLNPADSLFLSLELPECPMNMGLLVKLRKTDPGTAPKRLFAELKSGALGLKRHHQRLIFSPGNHDHPYWATDEHLDLERHFVSHNLPHPGDNRQLDELLEKIMMSPLDRSQPLFEQHMINGFHETDLLVLFKMHHACADGINSLRIFTSSLTNNADDKNRGWQPEEKPLAEIMSGVRFRMFSHPHRILSSFVLLPCLRLFIWLQILKRPRQKPAQASRFTAAIGTRRSYASLTLPRDHFRRINRAFGSSDNEVLLSIYAGALRTYLLGQDDLPSRSMHAGLPISLMNSMQRKGADNQVGFYRVSLGTLIADPLTRLRTTSERCRRSLEKGPSPLLRKLQYMMDIMSPRLVTAAARLYRKLIIKGRLHPTLSAITTYMPGPVRRISVAGYEVEGIYPLGVLYHGCGLSLSAMRYGRHIDCGIAADADMLPDPGVLAEYMRTELNLLLEATATQAA